MTQTEQKQSRCSVVQFATAPTHDTTCANTTNNLQSHGSSLSCCRTIPLLVMTLAMTISIYYQIGFNAQDETGIYISHSVTIHIANDTISNNTNASTICRLWDGIYLGTHHKTGSILMKQFASKINTILKNQCDNVRIPVTVLRHFSMEQILQKLTMRNNIKKTYIAHVIRDPINTVLSAYNYHLRTNRSDEWVNGVWTIKRMFEKLPLKYNKMYPFMKDSFRVDFFKRFSHFREIIQNKCVEHRLRNNECTYQRLLNNMNISDGLQMEYHKYMFWSGYGDIDSIFFAYKFINDNHKNYSNNGVFMYNYKLEDFQFNFNQTFMDILKHLHLGQYIPYVMDMMQSSNIYVQNKTNANAKSIVHLTRGTFNKTMQIHILLTQSYDICVQFKSWTYMLDYEWKYNHYC